MAVGGSPAGITPNTIAELKQQIAALENLVIYGGVKEPLTERAEKTLFTPSATQTVIVTILAREVNKRGDVEIYDQKGNHLENLLTGKVTEEAQHPLTFVLGAGESWEWRTVAGGVKPENVYSTYYLIGGIGSQGPAGPEGKKGETGPEGKEGKTGPEGKEGPAGNLTANNAGEAENILERVSEKVGKWVAPLTKKLKEEIETVTFTLLKIKQVEGTSIKYNSGNLVNVTYGFVRFAEPIETELVAGKQKIGEPTQTALTWLIKGGITAEVTGFTGVFSEGTLLSVNVRITAGTKLILIHREGGVEESERLNLPEGNNITIENPSLLPHMLLFEKRKGGWQLLSRTG